VEARFFAPVQIIRGVHSAFYTMGTGSFLEVVCSAEVKEIVELYLYSPSVLSWQKYRVNFTFTYYHVSFMWLYVVKLNVCDYLKGLQG
jgi:hypothetical protein